MLQGLLILLVTESFNPFHLAKEQGTTMMEMEEKIIVFQSLSSRKGAGNRIFM